MPRPRRGDVVVSSSTMLLSTASRECIAHLGAVCGYAPTTLANYERTHARFAAFLISQKMPDSVASFTTENVMAFLTELGAHGAVANTILNRIAALAALAKYLRKRTDHRGHPLLAIDPCKDLDKPSQTTPETKFLRPAELSAFMTASAAPHLALVRAILCDTGLRCSEMCEANVGDLQNVGETWYLSLKVKGRKQAGAAPVSVPVSANVVETIRAAVTARGTIRPDSALLLDGSGMRWRRTQLAEALTRLGVRAGITRLSTSPHKLRHTLNVVARIAGIDALTRASLLNHRSLKTLQRYDHLVPGETAKGRELQRQGFADYLKSAPEPPAT